MSKHVSVTTIEGISDHLKFAKREDPICKNPNLPQGYFRGAFVGTCGSGKTVSAVNMVNHFHKFGIIAGKTHKPMGIRTIVCSPTFSSNDVFSVLKDFDPDLDVIHDFDDKTTPAEIDEMIKQEKEENEQYQEDIKLWRKFLHMSRVSDLSEVEASQIEEWGIEGPPKPRFPQEGGIYTIILFDDLAGGGALRQGRSPFTKFWIGNRHHFCSVCVLSQSVMAIPKTVRQNCNLLCLWSSKSVKIICEDLYVNLANELTMEDFIELFKFATENPHDFFCFDATQPKKNRFKKCFSQIMSIST